ncbi:FkbM family methyltransferase [Alienimonas californiensis]|uniref:2-O-methyltransferase NoeI n=1 Tax=Alienimonas californiensis TaxID=2527989 RepID=A0A517P7X6_9PLAN|nr:FkbM family methyltransferase [Alienimonas californiensis]QDT15484.1 2-O-methyltransferase NoeI [Alienimonas californiensis]
MKKLVLRLLNWWGYEARARAVLPWAFSLETDLEKLGLDAAAVDTVLDVGANVGEHARAFARAFPRATVHAFEPVAATHRRLSAAVADQPRIRPHCLALSDADGPATIALSDNDTINSLEGINPKFGASTGEEVIQRERLDAWLDREGVARVDLLKLDVEGHELAALEGARGVLAAGRIRFLLIETKGVRAEEVRSVGTSLVELEALLAPLGYRLLVLYTDYLHLPPKPFHSNFNALFGRVEGAAASRSTATS